MYNIHRSLTTVVRVLNNTSKTEILLLPFLTEKGDNTTTVGYCNNRHFGDFDIITLFSIKMVTVIFAVLEVSF